MALVRTTLAAACTVNDRQVTLAAITGLLVGSLIQCDGEKMRVASVPASASLPVPVFRGVGGTTAVAHPITSGVAMGDPGDFGLIIDLARRRVVASYSAAGAVALPPSGSDAVAIINGVAALAMTLAVPSKDADGDILYIVGNGKAAHTVTVTGGLGAGGAALDVLTFAAGGQQLIALMAANEVWVPIPSVLAGTLTNITVTAA